MPTEIPIYSAAGELVNSITVPHDLEYESGRTSAAGDVYYKGAGLPYQHHCTLDGSAPGVVGPSEVFYAGYVTEDPRLKGKHGIVQQRYQPYFSDWIGSCGPKEEKIIENSKRFPLSAVEVVDHVMWDADHRQSYYVLRYGGTRDKFIPDGDTEALVELLRVMLRFGWNFPWDKAAIRDITADGRVSDVADMFRSKKLNHQLGTVYAVLYSLNKLARAQYRGFSTFDPITASMLFLGECGVLKHWKLRNMGHREIQMQGYRLLVSGNTCAGIEDKEFGRRVQQEYQRRMLASVNGGV